MNPKRNEQPDCKHCQSRHYSVFCTLTEDYLTELNINKVCNVYKKGQIIFTEGNRPLGLFCINAGKVKISKLGNDGREQIVRFAKDGDIIGYRAILSNENYTASATTLDETAICFIPRDIFLTFLQHDAAYAMRIMKLLSGDLKNAETKMTELAQKPVKERVAEVLLMLKEFYGYEKDNATINVMLTREDLANIVGTATETLIRLLSEFKYDRIIDLDGKKIKIINPNKLIKTANLMD